MTTEEFKTGEYVVYLNGTYRIENDGKHYILFSVNENTSTPVVHVQYGSSRLRLWTVQDAKDGDALVYGHDKRPFIFKGLLLDKFHPECPVAYCGIGNDGTLIINTGDGWWTDEKVQPANREQRDLLFQKMKEAGYEWDPHTKKIIEVTMATIDYKEKYMQALERARQFSEKPYLEDSAGIVEYIFPELKESEDVIRKELISFLKSPFVNENITDEKVAPWIAWLEKQEIKEHNVCDTCDEKAACVNPCPVKLVEQKPIDKAEPKFKVKKGKWYVCTNTFVSRGKIIAIKGQTYQSQQEDDTITCEDNCLFIDRHDGKASDYFRYWTIQDAKDGDVLSFNDGHGNDCIELIKSITGKKIEFWFCLTNGNSYEVFDGITPYTNLASREDATLASKEQRDILMMVMTDAGYEWDAEKKELKKIEQKPASAKKDKMMLQYAIEHFERQKRNCIEGGARKNSMQEFIDWLKSLKDRVQPQSQWKPSDMELEVLRLAAEKDGTCLMGLYEQLKKLREE